MSTNIQNESVGSLIEQCRGNPAKLAQLLGNEWSLRELHTFLSLLHSTKVVDGSRRFKFELAVLIRHLDIDDCTVNTEEFQHCLQIIPHGRRRSPDSRADSPARSLSDCGSGLDFRRARSVGRRPVPGLQTGATAAGRRQASQYRASFFPCSTDPRRRGGAPDRSDRRIPLWLPTGFERRRGSRGFPGRGDRQLNLRRPAE